MRRRIPEHLRCGSEPAYGDAIGQLPAGNAGVPLNTVFFAPELLAPEAYLLYKLSVPANMLWQTIIAINLSPLTTFFNPRSTWLRLTCSLTTLFAHNEDTLAKE